MLLMLVPLGGLLFYAGKEWESGMDLREKGGGEECGGEEEGEDEIGTLLGFL